MQNRPVILLNMAVDIIDNRENDVIISQYVQRVADSGAVPMLIPSYLIRYCADKRRRQRRGQPLPFSPHQAS